ncbi:MAG: hypothetical protein OEU46_11300, partial [Alphaproteobacteria bacterium]|nr:hypothetical protein [Alphaproteobacteria bacterium]
LMLLWDSLQHNWLTSIYPQVACGLSLTFLIPLGIRLVATKRPHSIFYDSEREQFSEHVTYRTSAHYLGWLLLMMIASALFGFVIGVALFTYSFIRIKGGVRHVWCAVNSAAFICVLGLVQHLMTLEYPRGFLQLYLGVDLPWPLQ